MIPNPFSAKFIVFEGPDGCGKSTHIKRACDYIRKELNKTVITTKEPNKKGQWGSRIYEELAKPGGLHTTDPFGFQTWYACDSKINLHEIVIPHLRAGCIVISDRFRPSMCYAARHLDDIPVLIEMNKQIIGEDFIWPDAVIIFDVKAETAIERLKRKNIKLDEHEKFEVLRRTRYYYLKFANHFLIRNCHVVDGEATEDEVFERVKTILRKTLIE
jgi:dTMP kinase